MTKPATTDEQRVAEEQRLARLAPEMLHLLRRAITHMSYPSDIRAEMIALVERADNAESEA